jgi:hypothetical protein
MYGNELDEAFKTTTKSLNIKKKRQEISLFRALIDAIGLTSFLSSGIKVVVDEIHQQYGTFNISNRYVKGGKLGAKRELGDLIFITYSNKKNCAKISYMQCKHYHRLSKTNFQYFYGDNFQYYLISKRPTIIKTKNTLLKKNPNFFKNARLSSVTSYGIFYQTKHRFDMAYYNSNSIDITGILFNKSKNSKISFIGKAGRIIGKGINSDVDGEENLIGFGNSLESMSIGEFIYLEEHSIIVEDYPDAPESFKALELEMLNYKSNIRSQDIDVQRGRKPAVFIDVDNLKFNKNIQDAYDLYYETSDEFI